MFFKYVSIFSLWPVRGTSRLAQSYSVNSFITKWALHILNLFTCSIYINGFLSLWLATSGPNLFLKLNCSNSSNCSFTVIHLVKQVFGYLGNQNVISKFYHSLSSHSQQQSVSLTTAVFKGRHFGTSVLHRNIRMSSQMSVLLHAGETIAVRFANVSTFTFSHFK